MALADFDAYKAALATKPDFFFTKATPTNTANRLMSHWLSAPFAGAAPSTAAAVSSSTTGAWTQNPNLSTFTNKIYLAQVEMMASHPQYAGFILCDRLSHQGGLSGFVSTPQTTNLPTAALTRYTSGAGVFAAIEIYTAVGSTATTATVSYTNQAGTSGRTSKAVAFGGANNNAASQFFPLPLADGDTGVQAVASLTLAAGTATAGNIGITLFKPLMLLPNLGLSSQGNQPYFYDGMLCSGTKLIEVEDTACLFMLGIPTTATSFIYSGGFNIIEVA